MSRDQQCRKLRSGTFGIPATGFLLPDGKAIWIGLNYYGSDLGRTFGSERECLSAIAASVEFALRNIAFDKALDNIKALSAKHAADHRLNTEQYYAELRASLEEFYTSTREAYKKWSDDIYFESKLEDVIEEFVIAKAQPESDFNTDPSYAYCLRSENGENLVVLSGDGTTETYWSTDSLGEPMPVQAQNDYEATRYFPYQPRKPWEPR